MSNKESNLSELLNDDSFVSWVKKDDQLSTSEKKKWEEWLSSNEGNEHLLKKAKKIVDMPFKESEGDCDIKELNRLKETIKSRDNS